MWVFVTWRRLMKPPCIWAFLSDDKTMAGWMNLSKTVMMDVQSERLAYLQFCNLFPIFTMCSESMFSRGFWWNVWWVKLWRNVYVIVHYHARIPRWGSLFFLFISYHTVIHKGDVGYQPLKGRKIPAMVGVVWKTPQKQPVLVGQC